MNRDDEALFCYDAALKIKPDKHDALNNKGTCLATLNRDDEALLCFDAALKIKPDKHEAHYNKGVSLSALNRNVEALLCFDAALKIKPDFYRALNNKGISLSALNRHEEAIESVRKAINIAPQIAICHAHLANLFAHERRRKEMLASLVEAVRLDNSWKERVMKLSKFEFYHSDPDFRALVGLPPLEEGDSPK